MASNESLSNFNIPKGAVPGMDPTTESNISSESPHSNRKRRKSVAFSLKAQTVLIDSKGKGKVLNVNIHDHSQEIPLSNFLNTSYRDMGQAPLQSPPHQPKNFGTITSYATDVSTPSVSQISISPSHDAGPASTKKRPFSFLVPPSPLSNHDISQTRSHSISTHKRSLSDVLPGKFRSSLVCENVADTRHPALVQSGTSAILRAPSAPPPPEFCAEANRRIRSVLNCPTFDFSQHILHRTYVVRKIPFSPAEECVVMLDAGVESLLPCTYLPLPPCSIDAFMIAPAQGKGKGLFARRTISNLEVILSERPVIITPYVIGLAVPLPQLYADIFGKLSKDVLDNLADISTSIQGDDKSMNYEALMRLNALAITLNVPPDDKFAELSTHRSIFLQASRCNHSCGPNAKWEWDQSTFSLVLTAVRHINPGEEITIAYVPPHLPYKARGSSLHEMYGFACLCRFCAQSPEQIEKSDAARQMLIDFWEPLSSGIPTFETWCTDQSIPSDMLINAHLNAIHLITREGLHIFETGSLSDGAHSQRDLSRHIDRVAMCYGAMEDVDNFRLWIQKALDARENLTPEQKLAFKMWLSNPVSFPAWGWRNNTSKGFNYQYPAIDSYLRSKSYIYCINDL